MTSVVSKWVFCEETSQKYILGSSFLWCQGNSSPLRWRTTLKLVHTVTISLHFVCHPTLMQSNGDISKTENLLSAHFAWIWGHMWKPYGSLFVLSAPLDHGIPFSLPPVPAFACMILLVYMSSMSAATPKCRVFLKCCTYLVDPHDRTAFRVCTWYVHTHAHSNGNLACLTCNTREIQDVHNS